MNRIAKKLLLIAADLSVTTLVLLGTYVYNYKLPQQGIKSSQMLSSQGILPGSVSDILGGSQTVQQNTAGNDTGNQPISPQKATYGTSQVADNGLPMTDVMKDTTDWHKKFASHFTSDVVSTDSSYTSPDISIQISHGSYDSKTLDFSEGGKHKKYGTKVAFTLADIYIGDITCFQTAFAQDTYGNGYSEKLSDMSKRLGAIFAVNGDSYNNNRHQDNGTIIRNGVIYRAKKTDMETCVLNWDGTMQIYAPDQLDTQTLIKKGAYQSWIFGPSLLDDKGKAKTDFLTWDYITESHPRTAIGYYEPGHYCLLVVDGREPGYSRGMFLNEEAAIFEQLGCKAAYNLDGGHCSFMTLQDQVVNRPYKAEHEIPDGIFIMK